MDEKFNPAEFWSQTFVLGFTSLVLMFAALFSGYLKAEHMVILFPAWAGSVFVYKSVKRHAQSTVVGSPKPPGSGVH